MTDKKICTVKYCGKENPDNKYNMCPDCREYYRSLKPSKLRLANERIKELETENEALREMVKKFVDDYAFKPKHGDVDIPLFIEALEIHGQATS